MAPRDALTDCFPCLFADYSDHFRHVRFHKTHTMNRLIILGENVLMVIQRDPKIDKKNMTLHPGQRLPPYEIKKSGSVALCRTLILTFSHPLLCTAVSDWRRVFVLVRKSPVARPLFPLHPSIHPSIPSPSLQLGASARYWRDSHESIC